MKIKKLSIDTKIKLWALINHVLMLIGLYYYFNISLLLVSYIVGFSIITIGVSAGYHRYYTHKSFKVSNFWESFLLIVGSISFLGPVLGWSGIHRLHHAKADTEEDPHSPVNGVLASWFHFFKNKHIPPKIIKDLLRNNKVKFQQKYYFYGVFLYTLLMFLIFGPYAIYLVAIPAVYCYHVPGLINCIHHLFGETKSNKNQSTDIPLLNVLSGGESYHSSHHNKPSSYQFGKYDVGAYFIGLIKQ